VGDGPNDWGLSRRHVMRQSEPYRHLVNDRTYAGLQALAAHAAERGTDLAALALAWVMSHPLVTAPILGPRRPEHLEPARQALDIRLTAEERERIAALAID